MQKNHDIMTGTGLHSGHLKEITAERSRMELECRGMRTKVEICEDQKTRNEGPTTSLLSSRLTEGSLV